MDLHREYQNLMSKKKPNYPVSSDLLLYLKRYERYSEFGFSYNDLLRWDTSFPVLDEKGQDTLWRTVLYSPSEQEEINRSLLLNYVNLTSDIESVAIEHLAVDGVNYCLFGNSHPFRVKIRNLLNDNHDYYYVKRADASRVYGLELEEMLSPNKVFYLADGQTLVEQHISGIPGDIFLKDHMHEGGHNQVRIAKEFVKFNQRCFVRLLGDMRSYNFVIVMTPDFDQMQYRIRAIDFDQQSYEGRKNIYLPQFFKENYEFVDRALKLLGEKSIAQYQQEENALMRRRVGANRYQLRRLIKVMRKDNISTMRNLATLKSELAEYHSDQRFMKLKSMGSILYKHLNLSLELHLTPIS